MADGEILSTGEVVMLVMEAGLEASEHHIRTWAGRVGIKKIGGYAFTCEDAQEYIACLQAEADDQDEDDEEEEEEEDDDEEEEEDDDDDDEDDD